MDFREYLDTKPITEAAEFKDSGEATDFFYKINDMIADKRLKRWAADTDSNYGTKCKGMLKKAADEYNKFTSELERADEM